jgi:hypothetical protein
MCNPVWTNILGDSTLEVSIEPPDAPNVVARIIESPGNHKRMSGLPISIPIQSGRAVAVTVTVTSPGDDSVVTITSQITGDDARDADTCRLRVNANHPIALETIMAAGG